MSTEAVFVTGATGFLGGALSEALLKRGQETVASGRRRDQLQVLADAGASIVQHDLSQPHSITLPPCRFMVHCAALSAPWGHAAAFQKANVDGTRNAIEIARSIGVQRIVHISTPSLYFKFADQEMVREDTLLPRPINAYASTKQMAENLISAATDLDPIILRPRGLYGRGDVALLPRLLRAAAQRPLPLLRGGRAATDLTHVSDVVDAIIAALDLPISPPVRTFNVSGGVALPITGVVNQACARAGIQPRWRRLPWAIVKTYARLAETASKIRPDYPEPIITAYGAGLFAYRQTLDISAAHKHLEWRPKISFEEGIERTFSSEGKP